ncbi:MAG: HmuY family protein [Dysgonamonadaceae bacterium]|jgi:hypothetical protein|nr:HmuY family protein [Dysgonamonadaceae bacterium]
MKNLFFIGMTLLASVFVSCSKEDDNDPQPDTSTKEMYIDATSQKDWHYFSFSKGEIIGSDADSIGAEQWAARKDWDIAICRYNIRTNSGEFTKADAKGGVYTFDGATKFESVNKVPSGAVFVTDKSFTTIGMGGVVTTQTRSDATVILFKKKEDGSLIMPPVFLQAPVYVFRTADGAGYYKVQFTQYQNDSSVAGHVRFNFALITQ